MRPGASFSADAYRACMVVPVFEHHLALAPLLPALRALGLPMLLVDDGSGPECAAALEVLVAGPGPGLPPRLHRRSVNSGKGAAVKDGLKWAAELGFTHALQVDADGQHALEALPVLLEASRREPDAVICAAPVFGPDAPASRRRWRRLTNFWLAVNTLSCSIADGMCGLRVYPLARVLPLLAPIGDRMDFDPEILVRMSWEGLSLRFVPAEVRYPRDGSSGFRAFEDNALISWMHTRLFFGMLLRLPRLLTQKVRR